MPGQDLTDEMKALLENLKRPTNNTADRLERLLENYDELVKIQKKELGHMRDEIFLLKPFRDLVYHIASKRQDSVDDYIRLAKQCIADYENVKMLFALNPDLELKP